MTKCKEWEGHLDKDGYGRVYCAVQKKQVFVHRKVYAESAGIPYSALHGVIVRHKCDNPACYEPEHLESGTQKQNQQDVIDRGRLGLRKGETNNQATLSDAEVAEIRAIYTGARGELTALGKRYNTSRVTIRNIVKGVYRNG